MNWKSRILEIVENYKEYAKLCELDKDPNALIERANIDKKIKELARFEEDDVDYSLDVSPHCITLSIKMPSYWTDTVDVRRRCSPFSARHGENMTLESAAITWASGGYNDVDNSIIVAEHLKAIELAQQFAKEIEDITLEDINPI